MTLTTTTLAAPVLAPELPMAIDAEAAVLGSCLLNREAIIPIAPWLTPDMFFLSKYAMVYEAILSLYRRRIPPDAITVIEELRSRGQLDAVGGFAAITALVDTTYTSNHVSYYARAVERAHVMRQIIQLGSRFAAFGHTAHRQGMDPDSALRDLAQMLGAIRTGTAGNLIAMSDLVDGEYERLARDERRVGVPTGYRDLDALTGGLQPGDFIVLGARPSMGKSALMVDLSRGIGENEYPVLLWSLEMSNQQVAQRAMSADSGIGFSAIRDGLLSDDATQRVMASMSRLASLPIMLVRDQGKPLDHLRVAVMEAQARFSAMRNERPLTVFVDYMQLARLASERETGTSRYEVVSAISRELKAIARDLGVVMVGLAQVSRSVEQRASKIPLLSDLKESGQIEQDADLIMFLYREEVYEPDTEKKGIAELHIAKHRNGPLGVIPLRFDSSVMRFQTLSYRNVEGYETPPSEWPEPFPMVGDPDDV